MKRLTDADRAVLLRKAAGGKQSITLARAAEALGVATGHTMALVKRMIIAGMDIPLMADYKPNMSKSRATQRKHGPAMQAPPGERLKKTFAQPVRPDPDEGEGFEVDPEPIAVEVRGPDGKTEIKKFYRLR